MLKNLCDEHIIYANFGFDYFSIFANMNKVIGKRIKKLRHQKGYSQEHLAHELCISQSAYARLENGYT